MQLHTLNGASPTVAILTPVWNEVDEPGWAIRQVASVLACAADVHVITTQGDRPQSYPDGVFSVHELGTIDRQTELRRDVVLGPWGPNPLPGALDAAISEAFRAPW